MGEDIIILFAVVLIASLLQSSTGYGFSIIGTPFLLVIFPVHTAIQINIILSIILSAFMMFKIRNDLDKTLVKRLIVGSFFGLLLGIFIYLYLNVNVLKMTVGILIIVLTVLLILQFTMMRTANRDFAVGGFSGLLTTSIGVPGPPLLLYFSGTRMDKSVLRSTTLAYYLFVYFASLVMQISFGGTTKETWLYSLIAVPALFIGIIVGQFLFKWISAGAFRIITYFILVFTGVYLLITTLF